MKHDSIHTYCNPFPPMLLMMTFICAVHPGKAQHEDSVERKRLNALVIGTAVSYSATMVMLNELWYSDFERQSFTWFNDSREWKQMDKGGHFFSTYHLARAGSGSLQWAGVNKNKSDTWGALVGFVMVGSIEIFDGYSTGYGASISDLGANALGAGFFLGQQLLWNESRIHPKFSFHQTHYAPLRPLLLGQGLGEEIIKDYNGQTYWLSFDMDKFTRFPKWLNIAVGHGAHGMVFANETTNLANGHDPYRQLYLSLDFDVTSVRTNSRVLKALLQVVNLIKLPSPTLEFSRGGVKMHPFYF